MAEDAKLTDEQVKKFADWVNEKSKEKKGGLLPCEICHTNDWKVVPAILTPIPYGEGSLISFGTAMPLVFIMCENCGNTKSFNAIKIGIAKKKEDGEKKDA